jgi:hypothetical protein
MTPRMQYPVLYLQLEPQDVGYADGYRFVVEQPDGDRHFFKTREGSLGSDAFLKAHSLKPVTATDMAALRAAHTAAEREDGGG